MNFCEQIKRKQEFIKDTLPGLLNGDLLIRGNYKLGPHSRIIIARGDIKAFFAKNKKLYSGELFLDTNTNDLYIGGKDDYVFRLNLDKVPERLFIEEDNNQGKS